MIKIQILDKRSICHALLTSSYDPEIMIPVKGIIEEVYFEENIPVYSIRIIKFYDNINFLKQNFIGKPFLTNYRGKPKPITLPKEIKTTAEMENWLGENSKYRFCIESNLVVRTKNEMMQLFDRIGEYLILQKLRSIRKIILRTPYNGPIKINSVAEYSIRMERAFSDLFISADEARKFIDNIG